MFGLLLRLSAAAIVAIGAYTVSFPYGASEAYERIKFDFKHYRWGGIKLDRHISIKTQFGGDNLGDNVISFLQITKLVKDQTAIITIRDNLGGQLGVLLAISKAMKDSPAEIITTVQHYGFSAGTFVLNQGNYLMLPNDCVLLIHLGSIVKDDGKTVRIAPGSGDTEVQKAYEEQVMQFREWLDYLSVEDKKRYLLGEDVYVTGQEVCDAYGGSNPPILFHYKGGCVLKGVKQ